MENKGISKGLGDTIKKLTNAVGIKQCGSCQERQQKLNRMFPYTNFNLKNIMKEFKDG